MLGAAAETAWFNVTGDRTSSRLEELLLNVGAAIGKWPERSRRASARSRVLHVLTEAYATGGHTRIVTNWIDGQMGVRHDVLLTRQRVSVPQNLERSVAATGGEITMVGGQLIDRVQECRDLAAAADLVVLHIHPYDVIAVAALVAEGRTTPTVLVDHADHVFWVGAWAVDRVLSLRQTGRVECARRRGIDEDRVRLLPIPLEPTTPWSAPAVRERRMLVVTSPYKCIPLAGESLPHMLDRYLTEDGQASVAVAGVSDGDTAWKPVKAKHGSRVELLGVVEDLSDLRRRASVHLDSFPLASSTAWLESALAGLPVVSYRPHDIAGSVLAGDTASDSVLIIAKTIDEWCRAVRGTLDGTDPDRGAIVAASVRAVHVGEWTPALQAALEGVEALPLRARAVTMGPSALQPADAHLAHIHRLSGQSLSTSHVLSAWGLVPSLLDEVTETVADLTVVLTMTGGATDVVAALSAVLESCGPLGRIDLHCLDRGLDTSGVEALQSLDVADRVTWDAVSPYAVREALLGTRTELTYLVSSEVALTPDGCRTALSEMSASQDLDIVLHRVVDEAGDPLTFRSLEQRGTAAVVRGKRVIKDRLITTMSAAAPLRCRPVARGTGQDTKQPVGV